MMAPADLYSTQYIITHIYIYTKCLQSILRLEYYSSVWQHVYLYTFKQESILWVTRSKLPYQNIEAKLNSFWNLRARIYGEMLKNMRHSICMYTWLVCLRNLTRHFTTNTFKSSATLIQMHIKYKCNNLSTHNHI